MKLLAMEKTKIPYSTLEWAKQEIKRAQERNDPDIRPKQLPSGEYIGITVFPIIKSDSGNFIGNSDKHPLHFLWNPDTNDWELDKAKVEIIASE